MTRADHDALLRLGQLVEDGQSAHEAMHSVEEQARSAGFVELQRRLSDLNHAHELARAKEIDFLSVDSFKAFQAEYAASHQRLSDSQTLLSGSALTRERFEEFQKEYGVFRDGAMTKAEISALLNAVDVRLAGLTRVVSDLGSTVVRLSASLDGVNEGESAAEAASDRKVDAAVRTRNFVFGTIGAVVLVVSLYVSTHPAKTTPTPIVVNVPSATSTTVAR